MADWVPKTRLGQMVLNGEITTMSDALATKLPLREPEIVDILLPDLKDEVIDLNMVQRMTDSGRRVRFAVTCIVGNGDGFIGIGRAKGKEVGPSIKKAIDNAKLNMIEIKRGCGSWQCGCGQAHSLPFEVALRGRRIHRIRHRQPEARTPRCVPGSRRRGQEPPDSRRSPRRMGFRQRKHQDQGQLRHGNVRSA